MLLGDISSLIPELQTFRSPGALFFGNSLPSLPSFYISEQMIMALQDVGKTEHNGAKHTQGAWCTKYEAKQASKKHRRRNWKHEYAHLDPVELLGMPKNDGG